VALLAAAALMTTAACGSTVVRTGPGAAGDQVAVAGSGAGSDGLGGQGLAGGASGGLGTPGGTTQDPLTGSGTFGGGSTGSGSSTGSGGAVQAPGSATGTGSDSGAGATTVTQGPGVTATSIHIGITVCGKCGSANAALGAGSDDAEADQRGTFKAALADVNDRGGVLGRKLVPIFYDTDPSRDVAATYQEMCETWTKDSKVLVTFMYGS